MDVVSLNKVLPQLKAKKIGILAANPIDSPALSTFQVYYVPVHKTFQGVLTQLRLWPGVAAEEIVGERNSSLSPRRGDAVEIDWVCMLTHGCLLDIALLISS